MSDTIWHLTRGGKHLATLNEDEQWLVPELDGQFTREGSYTTTPAFASVRHLFERDAELLELDAEDDDLLREDATIWEELAAPGLFVESPDGRERIEIAWIHFKGGRAWWWPLYASPKTVLDPEMVKMADEAVANWRVATRNRNE